MIAKHGIDELTAEEYHADPCLLPSLSSSVATELLERSPLHAWQMHPRLNPRFVPEHREMFDLGTIAHAYKLQGETGFVIVHTADWRTKAAKELRDGAREHWKIAVLAKHWQGVVAMVEALNRQLDTFAEAPRPFTAGKPEQTIVWNEGDTWCRIRIDWLHDSRLVIDDLKTTGASANPEAWSRSIFGGPDIQAAFYLRGLRAIYGAAAVKSIFRFVVVENFAPFACSVISLGPDALVIAEKKVRMAIEIWQRCMEQDVWPAYPNRTCYASVPPWVEAQWLERELNSVEAA